MFTGAITYQNKIYNISSESTCKLLSLYLGAVFIFELINIAVLINIDYPNRDDWSTIILCTSATSIIIQFYLEYHLTFRQDINYFTPIVLYYHAYVTNIITIGLLIATAIKTNIFSLPFKIFTPIISFVLFMLKLAILRSKYS